MSLRYTIQDVRLWASRKGGKCLSKEYWDMNTKLTWMCSRGHTWEAYPYKIQRGNWCPSCGLKKPTIGNMHEFALKQDFKCLSDTYVNAHTKLTWKCKKKHIWMATPNSLHQGSGCPHCSGKAKGTIDKMNRMAREREGKCLSEKYINNVTKLKWQCRKGHVWKAIPMNILQGRWCPVCARKKKKKYTLKDMHRIAKERKGKCLSKKYTDVNTLLRWQCARRHTWNAKPYTVIYNGSWCGKCKYIDKSTNHKYHRN